MRGWPELRPLRNDRLFCCGQIEFDRAVFLMKPHPPSQTTLPGERAWSHVVVAPAAVVDPDLSHSRALLGQPGAHRDAEFRGFGVSVRVPGDRRSAVFSGAET